MPMTSIISHPTRGPWGKSSWRGNCSGHVYKDLFQQFKPKTFVDCMVGSGTSVEVAREMGIEALGLDLHSGFNAIRDSVLSAVGQPADMVLSHPPYSSLIYYSGSVWGEPHPDDLSRCESHEDFLDKMQIALLNQRDATIDGGIYGTIIGDMRKDGKYFCFASDLLVRMPKDELTSVLIKVQHNTQSGPKSYSNFSMPRIAHEYVLLWARKVIARSFLQALAVMNVQARAVQTGTWRAAVRMAMIKLGGKAHLSQVYTEIAAQAPEKLAKNEHWQAKVRQTLQLSNDFVGYGEGQWAMAA